MAPTPPSIPTGALVLFHGRPARVTRTGERLELDLGGETQRVRPKDVTLLHPGPLGSLSELVPLAGEMRAAWEILAGSTLSLAELAELAFGKATPAAVWAAWQFVADGLYFSGTPEQVQAATPAELATREAARSAQAAEERAWRAFLERVRRGERASEDERYLKEVEQLALGSASRSRALRELGRAETPQAAHALLLETGHWPPAFNPHPRRLGLPLRPPDLPIPPLPDEPRRDLTHLPAFAIDDEGNETPDDALSLDGARVWVHVADVAALVQPDSDLDREARARAETLHLPEGHVHLFPTALTAVLGLGMQPVSPALSFGIDLDASGAVQGLEITPSWVRVERLSYAQAERRMDAAPFAGLEALMTLRRARRIAAGAIDIDLPEAHLRVDADGEIHIAPILPLRSRRMVEEAMILAGDAAAAFAAGRSIPLAFSAQDSPESIVPHATLAGMFAMRRLMKRSQYRASPAPHAGLGLAQYAQVTSPLRRYLDLAAHQQLRAGLAGRALIAESALLERIGMVEAALPALRQAEYASEKHWTLVYLLRHPGWRGEAVLVERRGAQGTFLIPSLALEARVAAAAAIDLDARTEVEISSIDLPALEFSIKIAI